MQPLLMRKEKNISSDLNSLRQKAIRDLRKSKSSEGSPDQAWILKLLHELEAQQVELHLHYEKQLEAQEKAKEMTRKFELLFDHAPMGYFSIDDNGNLLESNISGAQMLGKRREELKNSRFIDFVSSESKTIFLEFLKKVYKNSESHDCELCLLSQKDSVYVYLQGVVPEDSPHCLITMVDITGRKKTEEALKKSETRLNELNATKDKFFRIISHDLRGPFSSIIGLSNLLESKVKEMDYEDIEEYAKYIRISSYRAMDLLKNLVEWSSSQTGKIKFSPQEIQMNNVAKEAIDLLKDAAAQKSISIENRIPSTIQIKADRTMIATVFRNLINNAIKFTHPGGKIEIDAMLHNKELQVDVKDNGVGIEDHARKKLFTLDGGHSTPGTENERGTGLGLVLCKEFISIHKGKIWAESARGEGSIFSFTIPRK
jgi:PAS domain S-box-containing protein